MAHTPNNSINIMRWWVALVCDLRSFGTVLRYAVVIPIVLVVDVNVNGSLFVSFLTVKFMFKEYVSGQVFASTVCLPSPSVFILLW